MRWRRVPSCGDRATERGHGDTDSPRQPRGQRDAASAGMLQRQQPNSPSQRLSRAFLPLRQLSGAQGLNQTSSSPLGVQAGEGVVCLFSPARKCGHTASAVPWSSACFKVSCQHVSRQSLIRSYKISILKKEKKKKKCIHISNLHTVREVNSKSLHDWGQGRLTCYYFSFLLAVTLQWLQQVKVREII